MAEYKRLVRSAVRLQCKRERSRDVERIFIKNTLNTSPVFHTLKEMFPTAKFIFNTRNFKPSFESFMQVGLGVPMIAFLTGKPFWVRTTLSRLGIPCDEETKYVVLIYEPWGFQKCIWKP